MAVRFKTARFIFKFNTDKLFLITTVSISNAIRELWSNFFNTELFLSCDMGKEINNTYFIFRSILKWSIR